MRHPTKSIALALLVTLALAGCSSIRPVTSAGAPATDPTVITAANAIAGAEQIGSTVGELLLASRAHFTTAQWADIADHSQALSDALFMARAALQDYQANATAETQDSLAKAINVLGVLSRAYAAYKGEVTP